MTNIISNWKEISKVIEVNQRAIDMLEVHDPWDVDRIIGMALEVALTITPKYYLWSWFRLNLWLKRIEKDHKKRGCCDWGPVLNR